VRIDFRYYDDAGNVAFADSYDGKVFVPGHTSSAEPAQLCRAFAGTIDRGRVYFQSQHVHLVAVMQWARYADGAVAAWGEPQP
jgi:hypothetical protein